MSDPTPSGSPFAAPPITGPTGAGGPFSGPPSGSPFPRDIAAVTTCPRCGAVVAAGSRFCPACGGALSASGEVGEDHLITRLRQATQGEYDVLREVGHGGMAAVYLAWDKELARYVAIKVLLPELAYNPTMSHRFLQEARTAANLDDHPSVVRVYRAKEAEGLRYFVMKYVDGCSLEQLLRNAGPLPPDLAAHVVDQVAQALQYAHEHGVVHRDVKPGNIMLDRSGNVVVTDFGIAKVAEAEQLTRTGFAIGTPHYMSPEQWRIEPLTPASDQYALGVVAYHIVAGEVPFDGTQYEIQEKHLRNEPPTLSARRDGLNVPPAFAAVVRVMLAKLPAERFPDLRSVSQALSAIPRDSAPMLRERLARLIPTANTPGVRGVPVPDLDPRPVEPPPRAEPDEPVLIVERRSVRPHAAEGAPHGTPYAAPQANPNSGPIVVPHAGAPHAGPPRAGTPGVGVPAVGTPAPGIPAVGMPAPGMPGVGAPNVSPTTYAPVADATAPSLSLTTTLRPPGIPPAAPARPPVPPIAPPVLPPVLPPVATPPAARTPTPITPTPIAATPVAPFVAPPPVIPGEVAEGISDDDVRRGAVLEGPISRVDRPRKLWPWLAAAVLAAVLVGGGVAWHSHQQAAPLQTAGTGTAAGTPTPAPPVTPPSVNTPPAGAAPDTTAKQTITTVEPPDENVPPSATPPGAPVALVIIGGPARGGPLTLASGDSVHLVARVNDANGTRLTSATVQWTSSDPSKVAFRNRWAVALAPGGPVGITATSGALTRTVRLTVTPRTGAPTVARGPITPPTPAELRTEVQRFVAALDAQNAGEVSRRLRASATDGSSSRDFVQWVQGVQGLSADAPVLGDMMDEGARATVSFRVPLRWRASGAAPAGRRDVNFWMTLVHDDQGWHGGEVLVQGKAAP